MHQVYESILHTAHTYCMFRSLPYYFAVSFVMHVPEGDHMCGRNV